MFGSKIIILVGLILALIPLAMAGCDNGVCLQGDNDLTSTGGAVQPGHPLYFADVWVDNVNLALNPFEERALTRQGILEERLAEFEGTQDNSALNDYSTKLQGMPEDLRDSSNSTREMVMNRLQIHERVLERVREQVPEEAKEGIDRAINRFGAARGVIEDLPAPAMGATESAGNTGSSGAEPSQIGTVSGNSYVEIPDTAEMGEEATIEGKICNDFNSKIESVRIEIEASKWMGLVSKKESRTYGLHLYPGQCYEDEYNIKVPQHYMGAFLKGKWDLHIKVTANPINEVVIDTHKAVVVE